MSERAPQNNRTHEGPAELIQSRVSENNVFDRRGMPGGKSQADWLTEQYGPEGTGWDVESDQYAAENSLEHVLHAPEFNLAVEAMKNLLHRGRYELDDGTNVQGRVHSFARKPDFVNVVKYPDGAIHAEEKGEK